MKTKLITSLRLAAQALEEGTFDYNWNHCESCNCGVLCSSILGISQAELDDKLDDLSAGTNRNWAGIVGQHCPITGLPTEPLLKTLLQSGLTPKDLVQLEYLENEEVLKRCNFGTKTSVVRTFLFKKKVTTPIQADHENPDHVAIYMRAWADLLTEQGREDAVENEQTLQTAK